MRLPVSRAAVSVAMTRPRLLVVVFFEILGWNGPCVVVRVCLVKPSLADIVYIVPMPVLSALGLNFLHSMKSFILSA